MTESKVYKILARALAGNDLGPLFGLVGDANLYMVDSYVREFGGRYFSAANENGAVLMALGYASVSGKIGLATVTHGPAVTNTLTALVEGVKSYTPIVLLCGDTALTDRENLQNVAQRDVILATGAGFEQLRSPHTALEDLARALRRAQTERRPVALNIPTEIQQMSGRIENTPLFVPNSRPAITPQGDELESAVGIIATAKRPIILAGRGACDDVSRAALLDLSRRIEAPLATTLRARSLFQGERYNLGIFGTLSTPGAVDAILKSDCVISFGASLTSYTTSNGSLLEGKRVVQVSSRAADLGNNRVPDIGLVGTPRETVDAITRLLDEAEIAPSGFTGELPEYGLDRHPEPASRSTTGNNLDFVATLDTLNSLIPAERILTVDAGRYMIKTLERMDVCEPRRMVHTASFGSIGLGMAYAIGAAVAEPDLPVVLFVGDGGFMLGGLTEFNSAVRHGVNLTVILCNDGSYGAEHVQLRNKQMDPSLIMFDWPEFAPVAQALGGRGITVRSLEDLQAAGAEIAKRGKPLLIDVKLDPDNVPFH